MATIEVSTWAELRTAIINADNGDTIKLIKDIDCNDEIPEGASTITSASYAFTVDGSYVENGVTKNHVIRNLRTGVTGASPIFLLVSPIGEADKTTKIFKNIDFINLILDSSLFRVRYYTSISIRNCRFTGKRTHYLIDYYTNSVGYNSCWMYSCYFNIPYYGTTYEKVPLAAYLSGDRSYKYSYAHYCRFKETYTGTWNPSTYIEAECCSVSHTWLNGCRVEGTIVNGSGAYFHTSGVIGLGTPTMQNVYDVDFKLTSNDSESVDIRAFKGVVKIPVRKYSDGTPYGVASYSTGVIPATESQMKDTDWLIQHNFDVVPSDT